MHVLVDIPLCDLAVCTCAPAGPIDRAVDYDVASSDQEACLQVGPCLIIGRRGRDQGDLRTYATLRTVEEEGEAPESSSCATLFMRSTAAAQVL